MSGPNRRRDDPEDTAETAVLRGLDAVLRGDFAGASIEYRAATADDRDGAPEPGVRALGHILAAYQLAPVVVDRPPPEWAAMAPEQLRDAALDVLTVLGGGGSVGLSTLRAGLTAVEATLAAAATEDDHSSAPWIRVGWMGIAAELNTAIASDRLAAADQLPAEQRDAALADAQQRADRAHLLLGLVDGQLDGTELPPGVVLFDPKPAAAINSAVRGRIALALGDVDGGVALLIQARDGIPAGRPEHAEVLIDLAIVAERDADWRRVADLAVPALLVLDAMHHDKLLRAGRLDAVDRVDVARELAFAAAEELDDHRLLAELVCHAARFGRYLPLHTAAARLDHAHDIAAAAGLDIGGILAVERVPLREWPWPGILAATAP